MVRRVLSFLGMGGCFSGSPGCSWASCLGEMSSPVELSNICGLAQDPATAPGVGKSLAILKWLLLMGQQEGNFEKFLEELNKLGYPRSQCFGVEMLQANFLA